jgi:hypothetical protein
LCNRDKNRLAVRFAARPAGLFRFLRTTDFRPCKSSVPFCNGLKSAPPDVRRPIRELILFRLPFHPTADESSLPCPTPLPNRTAQAPLHPRLAFAIWGYPT